jgi:hypothetical protein
MAIPTHPVTSTTVSQVDMSFVNDLFEGAPSSDNIISQDTPEKRNVFSNAAPDLEFTKPAPAVKVVTPPVEEGVILPITVPDADKTSPTAEELEDLLNPDPDAIVDEDTKPSRPKVDKSGLVKTFAKLIESEKIIPFDDGKPLEDYTEKDWEELLDANFTERERKIREETPKEFFDALPKELQIAAKYHADGGTDMKALFSALSHVEQVRSLDANVEEDQEQIVRSYLKATGFGEDKDIDEEISTWKDLNRLGSQAIKFKPKLDKMQDDIIQSQLADQELKKTTQREASEKYVNNVFTALKTGEINGLKLDKKTQSQLYVGLTQPQYQSITGKQTNLLGHLLEKHQFVEPNYSLISEALWLLSNPDEYRAALKKQGKETATEETVRTLKSAQSSKIATGLEADEKVIGARKIARPTNIFQRT